MIKTIQNALLGAALTLLAVDISLDRKQKFVNSQLEGLENNLKSLQQLKKITDDNYYAAVELMTPLRHPFIHDPWLLRYSGFIISGLLIVHSILFMVRLARRQSPGTELPEEADPTARS